MKSAEAAAKKWQEEISKEDMDFIYSVIKEHFGDSFDGTVTITTTTHHKEKFWTPAERAGLKALGEWVKYYRERGWEEEEYAVIFAIRAYVYEARRVKEGRHEKS